MKSNKKLTATKIHGSSGKVDIVNCDKQPERGMKHVGHYLREAIPKVYAGPLIEGKRLKLVEVISGNVEDRKPSMV
ncbi:MAG: hypothetical protein H7X86_02500 [Gorillibacterium sp.]|nr:hypothetical protein [Gorillibacterium sp.]